MTVYTKVEKEISTYTEIDKRYMGWLIEGWLINGWLLELYTKINKEISNYSKVNKE
jgi:hypothetical protein